MARDRGQLRPRGSWRRRAIAAAGSWPDPIASPFMPRSPARTRRSSRRLLDADPGLVDAGNEIGASPLHRAVGRGVYELAALLLDRGANVHAVLSSARGLAGGFWTDLQAIDLAIWDGRRPATPA